MGKKKFINKKNAVTLKLVADGDSDAPNFFKVVEKPHQTEKQVQLADLIEEQLNKGRLPKKQQQNQAPHEDREDVSEYIKGRDDLWINHIKKPALHPEIKLKEFDEDGLPIDGYDYKKHFAKEDDGGEVVCQFTVPVEERQNVFDTDFKPEELTAEQREIYEALMNEEDCEEGEIPDDFVAQAQGGDKCFVDNKQQPIQENKQTSQKKVTFQRQESDHSDDYEDVDIDDSCAEIEYKKNIDKDSESDVSYDSQDIEEQFEKEMKAFDRKGPAEEKQQLGLQQLDKILDEHLLKMSIPQKKVQKPLDPVEEEHRRAMYLRSLKSKDYLAYLKEKYPDVDPADFHLKKEIPQLSFEEDQVLQAYLNRDSTDEELPPLEVAVHDELNIHTKTIHESTMSKMNPEQLNIIKYKARLTKQPVQKDKVNMKELRELKKEQKDAQNGILNIYLEQLTLLELKKDATAEEKKQRKDLIKQLKQAKKDKKTAFKEKLREVSKIHLNQKNANKQNNFTEGVSVQKL